MTLQVRLTTAADADRDRLYGRALQLIERIQRIGPPAGPAAIPFSLAFDVEKLQWEMQFFVTHFLGGFRQIALTPPARTALERELGVLVSELAAEPRVLCHRDYHSRNLMVRGDRLAVIDFQDARMGPDTYDLVSLLRDSYVDLPAGLVDDLVASFARTRGARPDDFRRRFERMALQRNLKALGTFGYQATIRANPTYAQYVPRTLDHVRTALARQPGVGALGDVLAAALPELRSGLP